MKLDILAIGAHPDDVELGCSATIAKEIQRGKKVGIIDLTQGELGTRGTAETRAQEAKDAAKILGVAVRENLKFADGFYINDQQHQLEVIKMIRKYKPDIILCNPFDDRHIDHGKGGQLVSDACFLSGLMKVETEMDGKKQQQWRPKQVYHYIQWKHILLKNCGKYLRDFLVCSQLQIILYHKHHYPGHHKILRSNIKLITKTVVV